MHIHIKDITRAICPFCGDDGTGEGGNNLFFPDDDYVESPMLFCWQCESIAFLDVDEDCEPDGRYPLMRILRVSTSNMLEWDSKRPLTLPEMDTVVAFLAAKSNAYREPIPAETQAAFDALGLTYREEYDIDENDRERSLNVSYPVNSYNLHDVLKANSAIDLSHDGVYVLATVWSERRQQTLRLYFWGD